MKIKEICEDIKRKYDLFEWVSRLGIHLIDVSSDQKKTVCVFHNDNDPSLYINRQGDIYLWHCFGCGRGGTIIDFYIEFYHTNVLDAIKALAPNSQIDEDEKNEILRLENIKPISLDEEKNDEAIERINYRIRATCHNHLILCEKDLNEMDFIEKNIFYPVDKSCDQRDYDSLKEIESFIQTSLAEREKEWIKNKNSNK